MFCRWFKVLSLEIILSPYYNVSLVFMYPTSILNEKDNGVFNRVRNTHFQSCAKKKKNQCSDTYTCTWRKIKFVLSLWLWTKCSLFPIEICSYIIVAKVCVWGERNTFIFLFMKICMCVLNYAYVCLHLCILICVGSCP